MLAAIDPQEYEIQSQILYEKLKRERIDPCKICNGTGRILTKIDWVDGTVPIARSSFCKCKIPVLYSISLFESGLPKEFWNAHKIVPQRNQKKYRLLHEYSKALQTHVLPQGLSLLLTGENGTGKTSSAAIAIISAIKQKIKAAYINWPDYMVALRGHRFASDVRQRLDARLKRGILVVDEIGKESLLNNSDDFPQQQLDSMLRLRRGERLPTILITNLTVDQFSNRYGKSVSSMISSPFKILEYEPGDYRSSVKDSWEHLERGL